MSYLESKTIPPPVPQRVVPWNNLQDRLREGLLRRLTLVRSVAGSGKTTCLNLFFQAAVSFGQHAVWLSLDSSDNHHERFWSSFCRALEKLDIHPGSAGLHESLLDRPDDRNWLLHGLGQISAAPFEIYLVLDNYQEITQAEIHDDLIFWIEHMPSNMHLALASRSNPPLPLSRLRGQDQLVEIRSEDLFLDYAGTACFLRQIKGITATDDEIRELFDLTGGWIAGLQIAASTSQNVGSGQSPSLVSAQMNRFIREYLVEEVICQQDAHTQEFLLKTSILNRLSDELCNEVAGFEQKEQSLDYLVHAGLFVIPLDESGEWYRYQPLFAKVLRKCLDDEMPDEIRALYTRASEWSERKGFLDDAIEYALSAKDDDRVIRLFERSMFAALNKLDGELFVLDEVRHRGWLSSLPEERFSESTPFLLLNAWSNFVASRPSESRAYLERAHQNLIHLYDEDTEPAFRAGIEEILAVIEAGNANMDGDYGHAIELSKNALNSFHGGSVWFKVTLLCLLGEGLASIGDIDESMRSYSQARAVSAAFEGRLLEQFCSYEIGRLYFQRGQLRLAQKTWQSALPISEADGKLEVYTAGLLLVGLGRLNIVCGDNEEADRYLEQARSIFTKSGNLFCHLELQNELAYLNGAQGRLTESLSIIAAASELVFSSYTEIVPRYSAWETLICHAKLALFSGDSTSAGKVLETLHTYLSPNNGHYRIQSELIDAMVLQATSRADEALKVLEHVSHDAQSAGYLGISIEAMVLRAVCLHGLGQVNAAEISMTLALDAADDEGFILPFMIEATAVGELLYRILYERKGKDPLPSKRRSFCRRLIKKRKSHNRETEGQAARMTVNLSKREEDILKLLEQGFTKQEIADSLHISCNTVKTHVRNIYKKLGVHDRAAAAQISLGSSD